MLGSSTTLVYVYAFSLLSLTLATPTPDPVPQPEPDSNIIKLGRRTSSGPVANIDALKSNIERTRFKLHRGLKAFQLNTGSAHPNAPADLGLETRSTGKVSLTDAGQQLWYGAIQVGTPLKTFTVDFDTGSSDFFLPAQSCTTNCAGHTLYNPASSSTAKNTKKTYTLQYGDGSSVSGTVYNETISLGGLKVTSAAVGASTVYSSGFAKSRFPADGLVGMAFPSLSAFGRNPVFNALVAAKQTTSSKFGFTLTRTGAELFIGGVDAAKISGNTVYTPVTTAAYWQVNLQKISLGSTTLIGTGSAIIDTGTTAILGGTSDVAKIYKAISGSKVFQQSGGLTMYSVPCKSVPTLSIEFSGTSFSIPPANLNLGPIATGSPDCLGGVIAEDGLPFNWVIGDVFLGGVYTTFDVSGKQVGFSKLK